MKFLKRVSPIKIVGYSLLVILVVIVTIKIFNQALNSSNLVDAFTVVEVLGAIFLSWVLGWSQKE